MNSETVEQIDGGGPIRRFLTEDHRRFDALLDRTGACASEDELAAYQEFRRGLLKHIGIEEKILLMAAQQLRGQPLEQAARLRSDHGALVALLMPAPTPAIIRALRTVIAAHNPIEEGPGGVYDICEKLAQSEAGDLMKRIREAPEVPTNPNLSNPRILDATRRALARAGYDPALLDE